MQYDKIHSDGSITHASGLERVVLESVPIIFNMAEWLLIIAAFQYIAIQFDLVAAKVVWLALSAAYGLYVGAISINIGWRVFKNTYRSGAWVAFGCVVLPVASVGVFVLLNVVVRYLVMGRQ